MQRVDTVHDIDFLLAVEAERSATIDLTAIDFIRPVGVVALLATLSGSFHIDRQDLAIMWPASREVQVPPASSMRRDGSVRKGCKLELKPEQIPVKPMVPCTHFNDEADIDRLEELMAEKFHTEFVGQEGTVDTVFSEIALNVVYHADSQGGYVLAQEYAYHEGPVVEIAVADCGIGIQASLQKNPNNPDTGSDIEAIQLALKEGVSRVIDAHRGFGLHHVANDVQNHYLREMTIRSGTGILDGNVISQESSSKFSGTIVNVTIPCETP